MTDIAIRVEHLGKQYRIGGARKQYPTLRDALVDTLAAPLRRITSPSSNGATREMIWALKDVSFEVARGEAVGIIGRNGAGKSTLLKILSSITQPTEGRVMLHGRVGSLLEVGTGFHAELTGRENIYLNGAILGMKRAEIERKFDEIVAFAEIEKFIDTPVKHYSSGMYVRLAFAVAAHLEPEILLVDEVLAVGDAQFQKKCLGKMGEVAREGRTVLFVSHNMAAVGHLCQRVLWVQEGVLISDGIASVIVSDYLKNAVTAQIEQVWFDPERAPGNDVVRLHSVRVMPDDAKSESAELTIRTPFRMEIEYWNLKPDVKLDLSLHLFNEQGELVMNPSTLHEPKWHGRSLPVGLFRTACHIPGDLLNDGTYTVTLLFVRDDATQVYWAKDLLAFEIRDSSEMRGAWHGKWPGTIRPNLQWETALLSQLVEQKEMSYATPA